MQQRSEAWKYFKLDPDNSSRAICNICDAVVHRGIGKNATTSTMIKHFKGKHTSEYVMFEKSRPTIETGKHEEIDEDEGFLQPKKPRLGQIGIKEAFQMSKGWDINDNRSIEIHRKIGEMIAIDCQPYRFVENEGFRRLMSHLQPRYKVSHKLGHFFPAFIIKTNLKHYMHRAKISIYLILI